MLPMTWPLIKMIWTIHREARAKLLKAVKTLENQKQVFHIRSPKELRRFKRRYFEQTNRVSGAPLIAPDVMRKLFWIHVLNDLDLAKVIPEIEEGTADTDQDNTEQENHYPFDIALVQTEAFLVGVRLTAILAPIKIKGTDRIHDPTVVHPGR